MLNRELQRKILHALAESYPHLLQDGRLSFNSPEEKANLFYLREHGLVEFDANLTMSGVYLLGSLPRITAKGMDFLADDGGLTAVLGTVVVKLHADSLKVLLAEHIDQSNIPEDKKGWLKKKVASLSGEALGDVFKSMLEEGIKQSPSLIPWLVHFFS